MSFVNWIFLFGGLAVAGPVIAHLLARPRFRRLPFTMLRFLHTGQFESQSRRKLRDLLILLLRCAIIVLIAMLSTVALLLLAWGGMVYATPRGPGWQLLAATCAAFALPALLNAMSRGRMPFVPALIVFASGLLTRPRALVGASPGRHAAFAAGVAILLLLWVLDYHGLAMTLDMLEG